MPHYPHSRVGWHVRKADLRRDLEEVLETIESESIVDIQFSFGAVPPAPGANSGKYGFCHTTGPIFPAGTVVFDNVAELVNVTKKGTTISPRVNIVGTVSLLANNIYYAMTATAPYSWTGKGGTSGGANATSIQSIPVNATAPTLDQVLVFDGTQYIPMQMTADMIGPSYVISSFNVTPTLVDVGQSTVTPPFTASYSLPPDLTPNSVVLTDSVGTPAKDVTLTPTSFSSNGTFTPATYGASVTFTLTAKRGSITRVATTSITGLLKAFWGVAAVPGAYDEAFIESLANNALSSSRARTLVVDAGPGEKIFYAYKTSYGDATFTVGGFPGGFFKAAASVSVTNAYGFLDTYMIWESNNPNLGPTTVIVT